MGTLTYLEIKARKAVKKIFTLGRSGPKAEPVMDAVVALLETQLQKAPGCGLLIAPDMVRILASKADMPKFTPGLLSAVYDGLARHVKNREYLLGRALEVHVEENPSAAEGAPEFLVSMSGAKVALMLELKDLTSGKEYLLVPGQAVKIGRTAGNAVVVADEHISGAHACVEFTTGYEIFLSDLNSANGTWFKGAKVQKSVLLKSGDSFQLAKQHPAKFEVKISAKN